MTVIKKLKNSKSGAAWAICSLIIISGIVCMAALAGMKEEPVQKQKEVKPLAIEVEHVRFNDYPTQIIGYGTAVCPDTAEISSLVSGKVVWVNNMSEAGKKIRAGETLFKIDPTDFRLLYRKTAARENEIRQNIQNLTQQLALDRERMKNLNRNEALAASHFKRITSLYKEDRLVSKFDVEKSEMELIAARLSVKQLAKQVKLYPGQIEIERFKLESYRAELEEIQKKIDRCDITAPFSGRIKLNLVENGVYIEKAAPVITLCDDESLEIHVPVSADDLDILTGSTDPNAVCGSECAIRWIDIGKPYRLCGRVDRIVKFNESTRTFLAAVEISSKNSHIMEGMFCEVGISGRPLTQVVKLPHNALLKDHTVFKVAGNRLEKASVTVSRQIGADIFVTKGLVSGDQVVVSQVSETDFSRKIRIISQEITDD